MKADNAKIRLTFTAIEVKEIYAALGARAGMIRDNAAISDLKPSEYSSQVANIQHIQDRLFEAIRVDDDNKAQQELL